MLSAAAPERKTGAMGRAKEEDPPRRRRSSDTTPRAPVLRSVCGLLTAKIVLCTMNVASFALAAGLVGVGAKKARAAVRIREGVSNARTDERAAGELRRRARRDGRGRRAPPAA